MGWHATDKVELLSVAVDGNRSESEAIIRLNLTLLWATFRWVHGHSGLESIDDHSDLRHPGSLGPHLMDERRLRVDEDSRGERSGVERIDVQAVIRDDAVNAARDTSHVKGLAPEEQQRKALKGDEKRVARLLHTAAKRRKNIALTEIQQSADPT